MFQNDLQERIIDCSYRYNGFGGKVEPNETPLQAAVRELEVASTSIYRRLNSTHSVVQEEAGIKAPLQHIGVLIFIVAGAEKAFHIDIYYAQEFEGTVTEYEFLIPLIIYFHVLIQ